MIKYILAFMMAIFLIGLIYYAGRVLRAKHDSDIRIVWYFYALTLVVSHLIGFCAVTYGAIDSTGEFRGEAGNLINDLIIASLDINLSLSIIFGALLLILGPQFISYIFSGLLGVAASPIYISESLSFLVWGIVKTFIVVSGILTTILLFGLYLSWSYFQSSNIIAWIIHSLIFCLFSFFVLMVYRESEEFLSDVRNFIPNKVVELFKHVHFWCTRHVNNEK